MLNTFGSFDNCHLFVAFQQFWVQFTRQTV